MSVKYINCVVQSPCHQVLKLMVVEAEVFGPRFDHSFLQDLLLSSVILYQVLMRQTDGQTDRETDRQRQTDR